MITDKNPVSVLNELRVGLKYNFLEQTGPSHAPIFKVAVEVDGQTYYGTGGSKKLAKCKAAEQALKSFIQLPNNTNMAYAVGLDGVSFDFTSDAYDPNKRDVLTKRKMIKGPVMMLNELYPNVIYNCVEDGTAYSRFKVTATVGDEKFYGTGKKKKKCWFFYILVCLLGSSKKMAKTAAATAALTKLKLKTSSDDCKNRSVLVEEQERADLIGR